MTYPDIPPDPDDPDPLLARALRVLREQRGFTQEDVAYGAGITVAALARIERCRADPHWTTILAVLEALEASLGDLLAAIDLESAAQERRRGGS